VASLVSPTGVKHTEFRKQSGAAAFESFRGIGIGNMAGRGPESQAIAVGEPKVHRRGSSRLVSLARHQSKAIVMTVSL
jgi:hypothetical protein